MAVWGYAVEAESEPRPTEGASRGPVPSPGELTPIKSEYFEKIPLYGQRWKFRDN
jgi:hypothetical protein